MTKSAKPTTDGATLHLNPKLLAIHPLAESLPMLDETDEKFLTMVADIGARGIDEPLKVDNFGGKYRVMDGRHRRAAAIAAELETVPCVVRSSGDAIQIIVGSLFARRHFTKSAQAYLAFPLLDTLLTENREKRVLNLKRGNSLTNSRKPDVPAIGSNRVDIARGLGFSHDVLDQAKKTYDFFAKHPEFKAEFEPQILSGEMSLWNVNSAMGSRLQTKGVKLSKRPASKLIVTCLAKVGFHFKRWETIQTKPEKVAIQQALGETLRAVPVELRDFAIKELRS